MAIIDFQVSSAGNSSVRPQFIKIMCDNTSEEVTTAGFLNTLVKQGFAIFPGDFSYVVYSGGSAIYTVGIANGIITLTEYGGVQAGALLAANNLSDVASVATSRTNLALGTAATKAVSNNANATVASVGVPTVSGNIAGFADTAGSISDGGLALTNIQHKDNIKSQISGNIVNGAFLTSIPVAVTGLTVGSVVIANVLASNLPCFVTNVTITSGSFTVTTNTSPGTSLNIGYVVFIAAQ